MTIKEQIHNFIQAERQEKDIPFASRIINTNLPVNAVQTKKVDTLAKTFAKSVNTIDEFPLDSHDAVCLAGFTVAYMKIPAKDKVKELDKILPSFDCWASVDCITCRMKKLESEESYFISLLSRENPFQKRVGIIWLMRFRLKEDPKKYLPIILNVKDEHYYVEMAKAWSLAESALVDFDYTTKTIENLESEFIKRKAISKCCDSFRLTTEQKARLKEIRANIK